MNPSRALNRRRAWKWAGAVALVGLATGAYFAYRASQPKPPADGTPPKITLKLPPGSDDRPLTGEPITDLTSLPKLDDDAKLLAAGKFGPDGAEFPRGVEATWPLAEPREPGSKLWIVTLAESGTRWYETGDEATVGASGLEATGTLYHFSGHGLSNNDPLAHLPQPSRALEPEVLQAMESARTGTTSPFQRALLVEHNPPINAAGLGGWIADSHYQPSQQIHSEVVQGFAKMAAESVGAEFTVQKVKGGAQFGTDSDFIVKVKSADPIGQIKGMQKQFNANINEYLANAYAKQGRPFTPRNDWHNALDVDFMADPRHVNARQFQEIAALNNMAYTRRAAADYERISRATDGTKVTAEQFREYTEQMKDLIKVKVDHLKSTDGLPLNAALIADRHRTMAQEQKYIERIEAATLKLREQARLATGDVTPLPTEGQAFAARTNRQAQEWVRKHRPEFAEPVLEVSVTPEVIRISQQSESLAARGAKRSFENRPVTEAANAVARDSMAKAVREMGEAMGQAAARNPDGWPTAAKDIATMARELPMGEKVRLVENIIARDRAESAGETETVRRARQQRARELAKQVEAELRTPPPGVTADEWVKKQLGKVGLSEELRDMGAVRRGFNERTAGALSALNVALEAQMLHDLSKGTVQNVRTYIDAILAANDPKTTDADAQKHYHRAMDAARAWCWTTPRGWAWPPCSASCRPSARRSWRTTWGTTALGLSWNTPRRASGSTGGRATTSSGTTTPSSGRPVGWSNTWAASRSGWTATS